MESNLVDSGFFEESADVETEEDTAERHWSAPGFLRITRPEKLKDYINLTIKGDKHSYNENEKALITFDSGSPGTTLAYPAYSKILEYMRNKYKMPNGNIIQANQGETYGDYFACPSNLELPITFLCFPYSRQRNGNEENRCFQLTTVDYINKDCPVKGKCCVKLSETTSSGLKYKDNTIGLSFFQKHYVGLNYETKMLMIGHPEYDKPFTC